MEIPTGRGYRWVDGRQVIDPDGSPLLPYFRTNEAKRWCKAQGWDYRDE